MNEPATTIPQMLADLVAEAVRQKAGGTLGVLVRDVPAPDPLRLLQRLKELVESGEADLRVAYLRPGGHEAAEKVGFAPDLFSDKVEQAEDWRNERGLNALIVVVAHGAEAKLSSLEDFDAIKTRDLKRVLVAKAIGEAEAGVNEVQIRWWAMLGEDDSVGLAQLADYYLALAGKEGAAFVEQSSRQIFRLGLLPDPELFKDAPERAVRTRYEANRELISRLQTLTPKDRRGIEAVVDGEQDAEMKRLLREAIGQLRRTRWEGEGMEHITFQAADRLVRARTSRPPSDPPVPRPKKEKVSDLAANALVDKNRERDLTAVVDELTEKLNGLDESRLRPETIATAMPEASGEAVSTARMDVINLMSKLLDDGVYGGMIEVDVPDLDGVLRRFNPEQHLVARWDREQILELVDHLAVDESGARLAAAFRAYDEARQGVLGLLRTLAVEPLAVAADPNRRRALLAFIDAHEAMNKTARESYEQLFEKFGTDARAVLGHLLLLETVVVRADDQTYVIAAPSHPLFIWHYAKYCQIVTEQRDRLDEKDRDLVIAAARDLPNFLTSMFAPPTAFGNGMTLPYLGRIGPLPYFGENAEASAGDGGLKPVRSLIDAYLSLEPHARHGFRMAVIDPPDAGVYLTMLADLADEKRLLGAHLAVYRHPKKKVGIELRLDEAEEDRVARVFRAITPDRRYTFEVHELPEREVGPIDNGLYHLAVVFDRSGSQQSQARPATHPIQPLALPRRIHYSQIDKTVELEPAPGGPFESYDKVVSRLAPGGGASYLSVHQDKQLRSALTDVAARVSWLALADRHVDRDLHVGTLRVLTARDGERDVAGFARSTAAFRRPLRDVVRAYNAYISDAELDDLLAQLSDLLDSGLLTLRPDVTGKTNPSRIKGVLGTLIAARWFRANTSGDRLLISLDGEEARRWLHLSDDPLRADLVGLEWTDDHCTVSVIEVKAVQAPAAEYNVDLESFATGSAISQMLSTRRLLSEVFANSADELITTPARREIIREHLYRELTKGSYSPEERKTWADRLQRLLDGEVPADPLRCHLVDVRLGVDSSLLEERNVSTRDGDANVPVQITELNERRIEALRQAAPPEPSPESEPEAAEEVPEETPEEPPEPVPVGVEGDETRIAEPETAPSEPSAVPTPPPTPPKKEEVSAGHVRALLGSAPGTYGKLHNIYFDPAAPGAQLPNPHISITGETGSGKTQATKAIIAELREYGLPTLVLDFKDDYSDRAYAEAEEFVVYDPNVQTLPFNPLTPPVDPQSGRTNPSHHFHQLGEIVKRIYGLGDQQAYRLREAMKRAYEERSIPTVAFEPRAGQTYPPFEAVREQLEQAKGNEALLGRMSPIFDLGLFSSETAEADFATVIESNTVVRLGQLPGDETKNSVAEFFLMALYNQLIRQPHVHALRRLLVLDEAWRLVESPYLEPLMREGRAFGLGVVIATQFPTDLPPTVSGSTATKLFFSQAQLEQIRAIQRTVIGKTSGADADHLAGVLRGLAPLTCVLHSKQHTPFVRLTIKPYFERES